MDFADPPKCDRCAGATTFAGRISLPPKMIYRCGACDHEMWLSSSRAPHAPILSAAAASPTTATTAAAAREEGRGRLRFMTVAGRVPHGQQSRPYFSSSNYKFHINGARQHFELGISGPFLTEANIEETWVVITG